MEKNWLPKDVFDGIYSKVPRLCIDLIILNEEGALFTKRRIDPYNGRWQFPGGTVLFKETIGEAIKRIAYREVGIELKVDGLLGFMEFLDEDSGKKHAVSMVFVGTTVSKEAVLNSEADSFVFSKTAPENTVQEHMDFFLKFYDKIFNQ